MMTARGLPASAAPASVFDYSDLDADAARVARDAAAVIQAVQREAIQEVGKHLLRARAALPHGAFEAWVRDVVGITPRTARNYMAAAEWLDGKPETVAGLPPTVLYALAAPTAPAEVVRDVVAAAKAGAPLDPAGIRSKLDAAAEEQRELRRAQRRAPTLTAADCAPGATGGRSAARRSRTASGRSTSGTRRSGWTACARWPCNWRRWTRNPWPRC